MRRGRTAIRYSFVEKEWIRAFEAQNQGMSVLEISKAFKRKFPNSPHRVSSVSATVSTLRKARQQGIGEKEYRKIQNEKKPSVIAMRKRQASCLDTGRMTVVNDGVYVLVLNGSGSSIKPMSAKQVQMLELIDE